MNNTTRGHTQKQSVKTSIKDIDIAIRTYMNANNLRGRSYVFTLDTGAYFCTAKADLTDIYILRKVRKPDLVLKSRHVVKYQEPLISPDPNPGQPRESLS